MIYLRSAAYMAWYVGATVALGLVGIGVRLFARDRALWLATIWTRALLAGARVICGIRVVVIGRENLPDGAALIASQHQSAFDTLVWLQIVPKVSYVFKAELARIPLMGPMLEPAGQIPLDRGASFAAIKALLRGAERAVAEGRQIVIFPEGTRVAHGVQAELRPGIAALAARTKLPVIPVATDSGLRWGRKAFLKRPGVIHVVIGPPIPPGLSQAALLEALRRAWDAGTARMDACG
jgi:1-acyl-sn-glycerol-3-phosphate acyltransferase